MKAIIVFVTTATRKEADNLSRMLVEGKLAACVSIVPGAFSRYRWKGRVEVSKESLLVIKTFMPLYKALEMRVRKVHSYAVPEILAIPVLKGNPAYLKWMGESVR